MQEEQVSVSREDLLVLVHAGRQSRDAVVAEAARRLEAGLRSGDDVQLVLETRLAIERSRARLAAREADEAAIREHARSASRRRAGSAATRVKSVPAPAFF
ncbi:MAG: hypothetical protein U1E62_14505 [Alsobacter sp.]